MNALNNKEYYTRQAVTMAVQDGKDSFAETQVATGVWCKLYFKSAALEDKAIKYKLLYTSDFPLKPEVRKSIKRFLTRETLLNLEASFPEVTKVTFSIK